MTVENRQKGENKFEVQKNITKKLQIVFERNF